MGKSIVYCDGCGVRLLDEEFARGRAFSVQNRCFCAACKPAGAKPAPPPMPSSSSRIPTSGITPRRAMSAVPAKPPKRGAAALWAALGAGTVLVAALLAFAMKSPSPEPAPAPAPAPRPAPPVARPPSAPPPAPVEAGDDLKRQAQFDRFFADVRGMIRGAADIEAKRAEIEGRIRAAETAEGGSRPEFKELRAELEAALAKAKAGHGLVGYWPLDHSDGGKTPDLSPNGFTGLVKGKAKGVKGRVGLALEFDGSSGHVELPATDALKALQKGSYSIAAWYRPAEIPKGTESKQNGWAHAIVMKAGFHEGLVCVSGGYAALDHWMDKGGRGHTTGSTVLPAGEFSHLVGVADHEVGEVRVYVNGKRDASKSFAKGLPGRDFGGGKWRIGIAQPDAKEFRFAAKGAIDEVRVYDRALSDEDAARLFSEAK